MYSRQIHKKVNENFVICFFVQFTSSTHMDVWDYCILTVDKTDWLDYVVSRTSGVESLQS